MLGKGEFCEFSVLTERKRLAESERLTTSNCSFITDAVSSQDQTPEKTKTAAFQKCVSFQNNQKLDFKQEWEMKDTASNKQICFANERIRCLEGSQMG